MLILRGKISWLYTRWSKWVKYVKLCWYVTRARVGTLLLHNHTGCGKHWGQFGLCLDLLFKRITYKSHIQKEKLMMIWWSQILVFFFAHRYTDTQTNSCHQQLRPLRPLLLLLPFTRCAPICIARFWQKAASHGNEADNNMMMMDICRSIWGLWDKWEISKIEQCERASASPDVI